MIDVWKELKYFSKTEEWGDPARMDPAFLILLDNFRATIPYRIVLTSPAFAGSGHAENSYHYKGRAVDCRLKTMNGRVASLQEHVLIALRSPFGGVGIYTWSPLGPFLHFDNRTMMEDRKIWVCEKKGIYRNLDERFLEKVFG